MNKHSTWPTTFGASFAAFAWGSLIAAFALTLAAPLWGDTPHSTFSTFVGSAVQLYGAALLFGIIPLLLVGIPLFGVLRAKGLANYFSVSLVGLLPGLVIGLTGAWQISALYAYFGLCVSLFAQLIAKASDRYSRGA
jgi:hypothetical protein